MGILHSVFLHPGALIALFVKLSAITLGSCAARRRVHDWITAWLHTWLAVQVCQIVVILGLSFAGILSRSSMWVFLLLLLVSGVAAYATRGVKSSRPSPTIAAICGAISIPLILWLVRVSLMPDFTGDAQSYGTVRIAIWMNYRSVLVHMPTAMVNIFADEWNGELNGLLYALSAGNIQGAMIGNAEILLVSFLAVTWAARRLGASRFDSMFVGLLMATTPAFIGLAAVTKGDLMACVGVIMAVGLLAERQTVNSVLLACIWLALGSGAKIAIVPGAAIFALFGVAMVWRQLDRTTIKTTSLAIAVAAVLMSRFVANAFVYRHPFIRVETENAEPGLSTLAQNLALIGDRFVGFFPASADGTHMFSAALAAGLGVAGWISVAGFVSGHIPRRHFTAAMLCLLSIAITAFLIPSRAWGFRYFLPFVSVVAILGLVGIANVVSELRRPWRYGATLAIVAVAYLDFGICFIGGELCSPGGFETAIHESIGRPPIKLAEVSRDFLLSEINQAQFALDSDSPKKIAILNDVSAPILPFVGSGAQNRLYLAKDEAGLVSAAVQNHVDLAVIAKYPMRDLTPFDIPGFRWIANGPYYDIAKPITVIEKFTASQ